MTPKQCQLLSQTSVTDYARERVCISTYMLNGNDTLLSLCRNHNVQTFYHVIITFPDLILFDYSTVFNVTLIKTSWVIAAAAPPSYFDEEKGHLFSTFFPTFTFL